jgi:hypothetical protein
VNLKRAETIARDLIKYWCPGALRRFGMCKSRSKKITLSRHLTVLNNEEEVIDVMLHEIAHAIAPIGEHHSAAWRLCAQMVGAKPERCYGATELRCKSPKASIKRGAKNARMYYRTRIIDGEICYINIAGGRLQWAPANQLY